MPLAREIASLAPPVLFAAVPARLDAAGLE